MDRQHIAETFDPHRAPRSKVKQTADRVGPGNQPPRNATTSPSGREMSPPHTGQFFGGGNDFSAPVRFALSTLSTLE